MRKSAPDVAVIERQLLEKTGGCEWCSYRDIYETLNMTYRMVKRRFDRVGLTPSGEGKHATFPIKKVAYAIASFQHRNCK